MSDATYEELFERHHTVLFRYVQRVTGDPQLAEDVTQEAFYRLVAEDGVPDDVRSWLFTVAMNEVRDRARTTSRRQELSSGRELTPDGPARPDEEFDRKSRIDAAREVLDALDERDRRMLLMREEGFKYKEIAEAVGVKTSSVGTLLSRALEKFAAEFEKRDLREVDEND